MFYDYVTCNENSDYMPILHLQLWTQCEVLDGYRVLILIYRVNDTFDNTKI